MIKAIACIDELCDSRDTKVPVVLALCIGKAKDMGNERLTVYGMKKMVDIIAEGTPMDRDVIDIPALVRCTLQLQLKSLSSSLKSSAKRDPKSVLSTLDMIQTVLNQSVKFLGTINIAQSELGKLKPTFTNVDIVWISSKSYYAAVQAFKLGHITKAISLAKVALEVSIEKIDFFGFLGIFLTEV